ncbi:MAG TPA: phosphorylase [Acidobacteriaceae bacterium]|jgi:adenosylhomocysteine nucleosidase|nr:phosphorylase [Acidobacteriaceae bacterium]
MKPRIAIIAALPREVAPLIQGWRDESDPARKVFVHISETAIVAYAGMGAARAEMAVRQALQHGPISHLLSVGWAGALKADYAVGSMHHPAQVIDAATKQKFATVAGKGTLVSVKRFANAQEKQALVADFDADFVDMEAAAVARIAAEQGIPFAAVKAISDGSDDVLPDLQSFYTDDGWFREKAFALHVALRPGMWSAAMQLGRNASASAQNLCYELDSILRAYEAGGIEAGGIDDRSE